MDPFVFPKDWLVIRVAKMWPPYAEELLIENAAYVLRSRTLENYLRQQPPTLADQMLENAKADRTLLEVIRGRLSPFRDQVLAKAMEHLTNLVRSKRDDN